MIHDRTTADSRPTRVRTAITGYALTIAIIMYLDRVCIAQAAPLIRELTKRVALLDARLAIVENDARRAGVNLDRR